MTIEDSNVIGYNADIGSNCIIGSQNIIGEEVVVKESSIIGDGTILEDYTIVSTFQMGVESFSTNRFLKFILFTINNIFFWSVRLDIF